MLLHGGYEGLFTLIFILAAVAVLVVGAAVTAIVMAIIQRDRTRRMRQFLSQHTPGAFPLQPRQKPDAPANSAPQEPPRH